MAIRKDIDPNFPIFIYGLVDPRTNEVRYVGWCQDLKLRFAQHLSCAKRGQKTHKYNWTRKLVKLCQFWARKALLLFLICEGFTALLYVRVRV